MADVETRCGAVWSKEGFHLKAVSTNHILGFRTRSAVGTLDLLLCIPNRSSRDVTILQAVSVTELQRLNGFWMVRPDGSKAWPWKYLKAKISKAR